MSYVRGVLLAGRFRSWRELQKMSHEDQRNTLITELGARSNQSVPSLQSLPDVELAGAGALLVLARVAGIRDDATLRGMTLDDLRNTCIAELAAFTGLGAQLPGYSNLGLARIALRGSGGVRGVLLAGGFKTWRELNETSADDQRNALIWHLVRLCRQDVGFFQGMDDAALVGCGAMTVILRDAGIRDAATLATLTVDDQRNIFIVEIGAFTPEGTALQRFANGDLVRLALGDLFLLRTSDRLKPPPNAELFFPDVAVRYRGLRCYGESDWDGDDTPAADEPFVSMVVSSPSGSREITTAIYNDVDAGDTRPDEIELYRGPARGVGVNIVLGEHDFGDPRKMEAVVEQAADRAGELIGKALGNVPVGGAGLAAAFEWAWAEYGDEVVAWLNDLLDFGDDVVGQVQLFLSGRQLRELAAQPWTEENGLTWKVESPLISGQGASYKAVFDVVVI